jgi:hypothetical protein
MIHKQLDLQHWKHICSLQRLRDASGGKSPSGGAITGPCDIAALEQLRDLSVRQRFLAEHCYSNSCCFPHIRPKSA